MATETPNEIRFPRHALDMQNESNAMPTIPQRMWRIENLGNILAKAPSNQLIHVTRKYRTAILLFARNANIL